MRWTPALALLAATSLALAASPAQAGLVFEVLNSTAKSGGLGSFDVVLLDTGGTYQVSGFSIEPVVSAGSGVKFTSATPNPIAAAYLFGTYQSAPSPFATDPNNPNSPAQFPLTDFVASDADFTAPYFVTLNTGNEYGLAHVTYSVAQGTPTGSITVSLASSGTSLSDINGDPITFTTSNGIIGVVPEPASIVSLLLGVALIGICSKCSTKGSRSAATRRTGRRRPSCRDSEGALR
jgi:hypothetical protein